MDPNETRLVELLEALQAMFIEAAGKPHPMIDALLDPTARHDPRTLNYLAATASGTPQDRIFCEANHDHEPTEGFDAFDRYRDLIDEAVVLAHQLRLPAGRDYRG